MIKFDAKTVALSGSNLIEASAGTGKTYSIAIMVLRLILEQKISIRNILMVTFTKAAVAELEERVRKFIRDAHQYASGKDIDDQLIKDIVDQCDQYDKTEAQKILQDNLSNLDETSVMTIHGFCQQTLDEFAFETQQTFNAELQEDLSLLLNKEVEKFWREHVVTIDVEILKELINLKLNPDIIFEILSTHLNGKKYYWYDEKIGNKNGYEYSENVLAINNENISKIEQNAHSEINQYLIEKHNYLQGIPKPGKKALDTVQKSPEEFVSLIRKQLKKTSKYVQNYFTDSFDIVEEFDSKIEIEKNRIINDLLNFAVQEITKNLSKTKLQYNLLTYDDLIKQLHRSRNHAGLQEQLRKKYQAVFIDEFQDTDREQYEIFHDIFTGQNNILFYIGDPKQSIYAWRKADMITYLEARENAGNKYDMNVNYRSSENFIQAMNHFYKDLRNPFHNENEGNIVYNTVEASKNAAETKGELYENNQKAIPISIRITEKKKKTQTQEKVEEKIEKVAAQHILKLLQDAGNYIENKDGKRKIKPSDIGVLVRKGKEGDAMKNALAALGIPAVRVDEQKIFDSPEARELQYILEAVLNTNTSTINRMLTTRFFNLDHADFDYLDEDLLIEKLRTYRKIWQEQSIYTMLMRWTNEFNIRKNIAEKTKDPDRVLTNLFQLFEILSDASTKFQLSPAELLNYFNRNIKTVSQSGKNEDLEQRIESDENAVQITTIHSSKGLQYPIVFAPFMDLSFDESDLWFGKTRIVSFRDTDQIYKSSDMKGLKLLVNQYQQLKIQDEQENRRLFYVTLTRAVYKCFFYHDESEDSSTLATYMEDLVWDNNLINHIHYHDDPIQPGGWYKSEETEPKIQHKEIDSEKINHSLPQKYWQKMSYSGLALHEFGEAKPGFIETDETSAYDQFIFKDLPGGTKTGTFVHVILEHLNFEDPDSWDEVIHQMKTGFYPNSEKVTEENIKNFIHQVLYTNLQLEENSFALNQIPLENCLHELDFDFLVNNFQRKQLEEVLHGKVKTKDAWKEIEGFMNGSIDLFFQHPHTGKYYILDWKTNYLGPDVEDYAPEKLDAAMTEANYHLQYLIYTLATKRFLESRLGEDFDYERDFGGAIYLFLRGMRNGMQNGVFFTKPSLETIRQLEHIFEGSLVKNVVNAVQSL